MQATELPCSVVIIPLSSPQVTISIVSPEACHLNYTLWLFSVLKGKTQGIVYCDVREKTNKMQQLDVYFQQYLNMFRASLCPSSGEQDMCYCMWCAALVLLDVVGSGCGSLPCGVRALWRLLFDSNTPQGSAPQPLPTTSSRTSAAHHMQ